MPSSVDVGEYYYFYFFLLFPSIFSCICSGSALSHFILPLDKGKKEMVPDLPTPTPGHLFLGLGNLWPLQQPLAGVACDKVAQVLVCAEGSEDTFSLMTLGREGKRASPPLRGSARGADRWPVLLQIKVRLVTECSGLSGPPCSPGGELLLPRRVLGFHTWSISPALGRPWISNVYIFLEAHNRTVPLSQFGGF